MNFICLDLETANESLASICQIGLGTFVDGVHYTAGDVCTFVNPEEEFLDMNTSIHGITAADTQRAPTFPKLYGMLKEFLTGMPVLCHGFFDRVALQRACEKYDLPEIQCVWIDTLRIARRAWPDRRGNGGHRLVVMTTLLGIQHDHHNALSDAVCCGSLFLYACEMTGMGLEEWRVRCSEPATPAADLKATGNPAGHLYGETVVFTGAATMPRAQLVKLAAEAGCAVNAGVTKHTTMVVVGTQDIRMLNGHEISAKHLKARELVAKGKSLQIVGEDDFLRLLRCSG